MILNVVQRIGPAIVVALTLATPAEADRAEFIELFESRYLESISTPPAQRTLDTTVWLDVSPTGNYAERPSTVAALAVTRRELSDLFARPETVRSPDTQLVLRVGVKTTFSGMGVELRLEDPEGGVLAESDHVFKAFTAGTTGNLERALTEAKRELTVWLARPEVLALAGPPPPAASEAGPPPLGTSRDVSLGSEMYGLEEDLRFNVLDQVVFDPEQGQLVLTGHRDESLGDTPIPYLQHLATLLEHPRPEFSLDWTPESERKVAELFERTNSDSDLRRLVESSRLRHADGSATEAGRVFLPLLGVQPTQNPGPLGFLGVEVAPTGLGEVRVTGITPGSPASTIDLRVGDLIHLATSGDVVHQPYHPAQFRHWIRRRGAGSEIVLHTARGADLSVRLGAASGDPFAELDEYDMAEALFIRVGDPGKADVFAAMGEMQRVGSGPGGLIAFQLLLLVTNSYEAFEAEAEEYRAGRISKDESVQRGLRAATKGLEETCALEPGVLTRVFDAEVARGGGDPHAAALKRFESLIPGMKEEAFRKLLNEADEFVLPVGLAGSTAARPMVEPRFVNVDRTSQLARVMFEADLLGKRLISQPQLSEVIPGYRTEYAHAAERSEGLATKAADRRMWISITDIDARQSPDGRVLELGDVDLSFHIRAIEAGRDVDIPSESYDDLLTTLMPEFQAHFPVMHELHEAAKLTAVAEWMRATDPAFRLPRAGRAAWQAPREVSGVVNLVWSPRRSRVALIAPGGVSLVPFDWRQRRLPSDPAVVDLRPPGQRGKMATPRGGGDTSVVVVPGNEALSDYGSNESFELPRGLMDATIVDLRQVSAAEERLSAPSPIHPRQAPGQGGAVDVRDLAIRDAVAGVATSVAATSPRANLLLDALDHGRGNWDRAIEHLRQLLRRDPTNTAARDALAYLKGMHEGHLATQQVSNKHFDWAVEQWLGGNHGEAARAFARAWRENPDDLSALQLFAFTLGQRDAGSYCQLVSCEDVALPASVFWRRDDQKRLEALHATVTRTPQALELRASMNYIAGFSVYSSRVPVEDERALERSMNRMRRAADLLERGEHARAATEIAASVDEAVGETGLTWVLYYARGLDHGNGLPVGDGSGGEPWDSRMNKVYERLHRESLAVLVRDPQYMLRVPDPGDRRRIEAEFRQVTKRVPTEQLFDEHMREQLKRERRRTEEPKPLDPASLREIDQMIQQDQDEVIFQYLLYRMAKESGL